jgi:hypothetical protein
MTLIDLPSPHYWFSSAALFLALSFGITLLIGIIPIFTDKGRKTAIFFIVLGGILVVVGWYDAAKQEMKGEQHAPV